MVVWPQTNIKVLAKFKFGSGGSQHLHYPYHCTRVYQEALPFPHLKYLNKTMSLQIYKKYNGQCAGTKPAMSTAHVEGHQVGPRGPLHAFCHYVLWAKMILVNFNLVVSIPTPKLPNLIPRQIFRLYGM